MPWDRRPEIVVWAAFQDQDLGVDFWWWREQLGWHFPIQADFPVELGGDAEDRHIARLGAPRAGRLLFGPVWWR